MDTNGNKIFAVDFDGTLSFGKWPEIGEPNRELFDYLIRQQQEGARIILNTCRTRDRLHDAVLYCRKHGLEFDAVNENLPELIELYGEDTRKIEADIYIDDKAVNPVTGALFTGPLKFDAIRTFYITHDTEERKESNHDEIQQEQGEQKTASGNHEAD